jgi:hypothetical protein
VVVSYTSGLGATPNPGQLAPTSFEPPATGNVGPYTGSIENIRKSPWTGILDAAGIASAPYYAVIPVTGSPAGAQSTSATYAFNTPQTFFSLLWGSPDTYNTIDFLDENDALVFTISGATVIANLVPNGLQAEIGNIVSFVFDGGDTFSKAVLKSGTTNAFEWANAVVPLPAAAWLMLAGLGGLGLMSRRRKAA